MEKELVIHMKQAAIVTYECLFTLSARHAVLLKNPRRAGGPTAVCRAPQPFGLQSGLRGDREHALMISLIAPNKKTGWADFLLGQRTDKTVRAA